MSWKLRALLCLSLAPALYPQTPAAPREPVAVVNGQPLYEEDLLPLIQPQLMQLRSQEYDLRSRSLDELINRKLLDAEAKKRDITTQQLMDLEVNSKMPEPADVEVEHLYNAQKDRINRPLADVKEQLRQVLKEAKIQPARDAYFKALRQKAAVEILLNPPRVKMGYDLTRVRGNPDAPITIIEFSDFQCPYCQSVEATLRGLLAKYDGQVKLAFRDFPLEEIHGQAASAGEAALCAGEQGRFWEYHDLIYASQTKLDREHLLERAGQLKLDPEAFESCLTTRKFKDRVEQDRQEGMKAGVNGTPGFFINGVFLSGAQPAAVFDRIIENELALARRRGTPAR